MYIYTVSRIVLSILLRSKIDTYIRVRSNVFLI